MSWFALRCASGREESIAAKLSGGRCPACGGWESEHRAFCTPSDRKATGFGPPFRSYCPLHESDCFRRGRRTADVKPMFSRYVFVDWEPKDDADAWHRVVGLPGALGFIGGERPMPIREDDIEKWISRTDATGVVRGLEELIRKLKRGFDKDDLIRIEGGPFDDRVFRCLWTDDGGVSVEVEILGHPQPLYLADAQCRFRLERAAEAPLKPKKHRDYLTNLARGVGALL